ncbi:MAG: preprotein translocase subunit SecY [Micavibrio sp.]|jgi:preprotein translocase subunit SecY|nr:MAG: preprotein translocase subunit SecY [Micavibrio sp.]
MSSATEQFAANFNFGALARAGDLKARLKFTLLALLIYRAGTYIPLPGIDPQAWQDFFSQQAGSIFDMFNMFAGGALQRMSIFTMSIMPYITAAIIMQIMSHMVPFLDKIRREGPGGQQKITQYTRYLTIIFATVQAFALSTSLESMGGGSVVIDPGFFFRATTVITLVGATVFLMWIGEQITARGVGNGLSLIIFAGIVAELPRAVAGTLEMSLQGAIAPFLLLFIVVMVVSVMTFVVFMERAQRRLVVQYPKRQVSAGKMFEGTSNYLPLKLNPAGVIPPIFASALLLSPMTMVGLSGSDGSPILDALSRHLQHGSATFMILYALLIVFFCFFHTAIVHNPDDQADNMKRSGGFIPGIRPGPPTANYINFVMTRIIVIGSAYLVFVCLLPEFLLAKYGLPFYFGGTPLLIVVTVTIDTVAHIQSHLLAHQYEGLLKKTKLGGKRRT